jgi:hypothetical protein
MIKYLGIVARIEVTTMLTPPTNTTTMMLPLTDLMAWFSWTESPHPQKNLQEGLTKGGMAGFYYTMQTGLENFLNKFMLANLS